MTDFVSQLALSITFLQPPGRREELNGDPHFKTWRETAFDFMVNVTVLVETKKSRVSA
jgi:hypothetical protein